MSKLLFAIVAFAILASCSSSPTKNTSDVQKEADCPAFIAVGRVKICLPEIDSMVESYTDSIVKVWADNHELKGNTVLSFFLRNPTIYQNSPSGEKLYDDFFKIYQVDNLKDLDVDEKYLDDVANSIATSNTFVNWGETMKKLQKDYSFIPETQPYFIDQYSPHPHVRSFVVLYRYNPGAFETVLMGIMNIMLIKKRLVGLTYYKAFMGVETLARARTKSDAIVGKIMAVNESEQK